jgi:hypothetical protein
MGDLYMKRLTYGILGITLHVPAFVSMCSAIKGVLGRACHEDDEEEGWGGRERESVCDDDDDYTCRKIIRVQHPSFFVTDFQPCK